MILGTHNSLTYKTPMQWYLRPFAFIARCQKINWNAQYRMGVRYYDMRIRYVNGKICIAHGLFNYDAYDLYDFLYFMNNRLDTIYVNFTIEDRNVKLTDENEKHFVRTCKYYQNTFPKLKFVGGHCIGSGKQLYNFGNECPEVLGYYSSVTSLFKSQNKILKVIDDLLPLLYAKLNTKKKYKELFNKEDNKILMLDFVDMI